MLMKEDKITAMWEEDGDLMRVKEFFAYIRQDEDLKDRIKKKTLEKISVSNDSQAFEAKEEQPISNIKKNNTPTLKVLQNKFMIKRTLKILSAAAVVVFAVYLGSTGFLQNATSPLRVGSASQKAADTITRYSTANEGVYNSVAPSVPPSPSLDAKGKADGANSSVMQKSTRDTAFLDAKTEGITAAEAGASASAGAGAQTEPIQQKIIYVLDVSLKADNVAAAMKAVEEKVTAEGGYIAESNQNNNEKGMTVYLSLRIPADKFQSFKGNLSQFGTVENEHLSSDDVSRQYFDVETRLKSWQAQEKRYLEILQQAKTVEEILKIEDSLANVRREMESLKGQLKYWDNHVQYSEIRMNISPTQSKLTVNDPWTPVSISNTLQAAKNAVIKTISFLWNAVNYLIVFIGYAIPVAILLGIAWFVWKKVRKRKKTE
ncbi:MAG: DUF4349 domain-containing protein [Peptococcaceae bacterium]|nr:DUF4349 domain-containing protein [Peptococcaceae bacterium]